jgi:lipoic acid synthetase
LGVLRAAKAAKPSLFTKTSVMLGLGEEPDEIRRLLEDLREADVDIVTLGQYLRPTRRHTSVKKYVTPDEFTEWQKIAESLGFKYVASGPLVRSSYRAGELFMKGMLQKKSL